MHYVKYRRYWQTEHFVQAGQDFIKSGEQFYCPFPEDTKSYDDYWDEHEHYIRNGYTYDGQHICGLSHLYLNFCPIWNKRKKKYVFPDFRSPDVEWFDDIEMAMAIGKYKNLEKRPSVHATAKTRQSGHSLKGGVPLLFNTHFAPGSKNYLASYDKSHAVKTLNMFMHYRNHLWAYTAFGKRFIKYDTDNYYKFGYTKNVNGVTVEAGYLSELHILSFNQKTTKGVGGGVDLAIIEEAGTFPKLLEAIGYLQNAVKDGDLTTGAILVYGAAGNLSDAVQFEKLAMNPKAYDAWAYPNTFTKEPRSKYIICFIPNYCCRQPHIDKDGNPMEAEAYIARDQTYADLKMKDYSQYLQKISQEPNTIEEMFDVRANLRFDKEMLDRQISILESNPALMGNPVDLDIDKENKVSWTFSEKRPIREYPVPDMEDYEGCVEMYEEPPADLRFDDCIIAIDSYNQEQATTDSFGSIYVYQKASGLTHNYGRRIMAEYFGRPAKKETLYKICLYLAILYKGRIMVENEDTEIVPWFYNRHMDHLLYDQPDIIRSLIPNSKTLGKRAKGIHAADPLIIAADNKQDRYMTEHLGVKRDEEGNTVGEILGVSRIRSLGYLKEARRYLKHPDLNFDRIRTFGWALMTEDETYVQDEAKRAHNPNDSFLTGMGGDRGTSGTSALTHAGMTYDERRGLWVIAN